ncbi:lipoprotein insertase outer membrane protein LolB [Lonsdalea quercina]|uniref:lipoprotein insertase outer membrane protein LolB n=1 Tax=Lonsdalea quercina TaxID=71657 RepID=UPI003974A747
MSKKLVRGLQLLPLTGLLLTACSTRQPELPGQSPTSPQWRQHEQKVQHLSQYETRGSFAYISDRQKLYARFFWQQTSEQNYRLLLTNPLGSTELELKAQPDSVQITDGQGKRYVGKDAEDMVRQLTGMDIPMNNLRQWIVGLPGDAQQFTLDQHYLLHTVSYQQSGQSWNVKYQQYTDSIMPMPKSLELSQGEQRIKLRMDNWKVQ